MSNRSRILTAVSTIAVAMLLSTPAHAQGHIEVNASDSTKLVSRTIPRLGQSITTRSAAATLLFNDTAVVIQMTDEALQNLGRTEPAEEKSSVARLVGAIVLASVKTMLDRGISYPLSGLDHAKADGNKVLLVARDGKLIFDSVDVNNVKPMHDFDESEAKDFAKRINVAIKRAR